MENAPQTDWFDWWFNTIKSKEILGITLITILITLVLISSFISFTGSNVLPLALSNLTGNFKIPNDNVLKNSQYNFNFKLPKRHRFNNNYRDISSDFDSSKLKNY